LEDNIEMDIRETDSGSCPLACGDVNVIIYIGLYPTQEGVPLCEAQCLHCHYHHLCPKFISMNYISFMGARGSVVVKALCCKPEGHGFKS
jgi:hypothetical protein